MKLNKLLKIINDISSRIENINLIKRPKKKKKAKPKKEKEKNKLGKMITSNIKSIFKKNEIKEFIRL